MNIHTRKLFIGLLVLAILSPIGLILPELFKAGDAWGEWSPESVKEQLGFTPSGMEKTASIWSAPVPDYNLGKEEDSLTRRSIFYIVSAIMGIGLIALVSWGALKIIQKK